MRLSALIRVCTVCILCVYGILNAQTAADTAAATVAFTVDFPQSDPSHYAITVARDGKSSYASEARISRESEDKDSFQLEFAISELNRAKIFDLASRANFFQGKLEANKKNIASSGTKTLAYKDAQRNYSANYN